MATTLQSAFDNIRATFISTGNAQVAIAGRTEQVDREVRAAYDRFLGSAFGDFLAVLAVGGYGRKELYPHSDIDLVLLVTRTPEGEQKEALSQFLRHLWDLGLRLSQSVRTVRECCELHDGNTELSVSLLDQRFLCGSQTLYGDLTARLPKFFTSSRRQMSERLIKLSRERSGKYQDTIYHLEPNVKETPGGIRDLNLIHWLRQLNRFELDNAKAIDDARAFLGAVRTFLHYRNSRDHNVLTFEFQDELAEHSFAPGTDAAAAMREYFRHARAVFREATRAAEKSEAADSGMLSQFRDWRSRLSNSEFTVSRERVLLRSPYQLQADPALASRLFQFVARHGIRLALDTERRIASHLPAISAYYAQARPFWHEVQHLLSLPHAVTALGAMHETGVLPALFPEWERIECLVVRDFYHRYTVDEHSLIAIAKLFELRSATDPALRRFAGLLEETHDAPLIYFALLFHDIGKGAENPGGHSAESLRLVEGPMQRIMMPNDQRTTIRFLIERHLDLSSVMTSRDLDDPQTARDLAHRVGTIERLKLLTLLTYGDISAVNPTAMTPWRLEQLWRVFRVTQQELTRELDVERIEEFDEPDLAEFLAGFPTRYLRTHAKEQIVGHASLARQSADSGVAIALARERGAWRLDLVSRDRKGLFAALAGAISSFGMNILRAEAFSNRQGLVLDSFVFADPHRTLELNPLEVERLRVILQRVALGRADVRAMLSNRPAPVPPSRRSRIEPRIASHSEPSGSATLIEIIAEDRPGLLYDLASAMSRHGLNIEVVLIDTEANKAMDVFYVTLNGGKLPGEIVSKIEGEIVNVCRPQ